MRGVHYAWIVLAGSVIIELFGLGFGIFALTTLYPDVIAAFPDWNRRLVFEPTSIVITTCAVLAPFTGALIDRFPIRFLFVIGSTLQGAGLLLFSRVETPTEYRLAALTLGFGLAGVTILPNQVLISRWFRSRVGLANGILLAATALGGAAAPPLVARLSASTGWRDAFVWLAGLAFFPPMLVILTLIRDRPATLGLEPYVTDEPTAEPIAEVAGVPLRTALGTRAFWALTGLVFFTGLPCYSFNKHILVFLREIGFPPTTAADYKGAFFAISACARLSFGWMADRVDRRRLVVAHLTAIALGYPLLLLVPTYPQLLVPCLLLVGVGYGGLLPTIPIMTVHYFGRAHLGAILGILKIPYDIAAAGAPLLTAHLYDRSGGYTVPESLNAVFAWVGLAIAIVALPRHYARSAPTNGSARQ